MTEAHLGDDYASKLAQGWTIPLPKAMPALTYAPAVFGVGLMFVGAGLATEPTIAIVGLVVVAIGAVGWIRDLVLETSEGTNSGDH